MTELKPPGSFSGRPIEDFADGWALIPFVGERGHYWREITRGLRRQGIVTDDDVRVYRSLCGVTGSTTSRARAMNVGNWAECKHCQKKAPRWLRKEERATCWNDPAVRALFR
jgi:hypothetical protein